MAWGGCGGIWQAAAVAAEKLAVHEVSRVGGTPGRVERLRVGRLLGIMEWGKLT